jgi:hypothetical protein
MNLHEKKKGVDLRPGRSTIKRPIFASVRRGGRMMTSWNSLLQFF